MEWVRNNMEKTKNKEKLEIYSDEYAHITSEIINFLGQDNLEEAEKLVQKREELIENIKSLKYIREEFVESFNNKEIIELENKCSSLIKEKLQNTKEKLRELKTSKMANENYSKYGNKNFTFLNKMV